MVPLTHHPNWAKLVTGEINPKITSFSLQMKINFLRTNLKINQITLPNAIKDIYELCVKYERIYQNDLDIIFNTKTIIK